MKILCSHSTNLGSQRHRVEIRKASMRLIGALSLLYISDLTYILFGRVAGMQLEISRLRLEAFQRVSYKPHDVLDNRKQLLCNLLLLVVRDFAVCKNLRNELLVVRELVRKLRVFCYLGFAFGLRIDCFSYWLSRHGWELFLVWDEDFYEFF